MVIIRYGGMFVVWPSLLDPIVVMTANISNWLKELAVKWYVCVCVHVYLYVCLCTACTYACVHVFVCMCTHLQQLHTFILSIVRSCFHLSVVKCCSTPSHLTGIEHC